MSKRLQILNPEVCFNLYRKEGTFQRVVDHLTLRGVVSPRTGRPFTRQAVHFILMKSRPYRDYVRQRDTRYKKSVGIMSELQSELAGESAA